MDSAANCICQVLFSLMNGVTNALQTGDGMNNQSDLGETQDLNVGEFTSSTQDDIATQGNPFLGSSGPQVVAMMVFMVLAIFSLLQNRRGANEPNSSKPYTNLESDGSGGGPPIS